MSSAFENFFKDNLVNTCLNNNFKDLNCILGASEMVLSLILIFLVFFGLIKLLNYYETINFEISLLIFSIIQIFLLDIIIIIPHDFLFECFFFVQIFHISLTIRKFLILTRNSTNKITENIIFIIINIINIVIFTFYILSLLKIYLKDIYFIIQSSIRIFYFINAIILTYLCCSLIKKIRIVENKNEKYELNLKHQDSNHSNKTNNSNITISFNNNEWMFFLIRERQITPLYILNLICSFIQMSFILSKHFLLSNDFSIKFKCIASNNKAIIIYNVYILICFLNILVNYFCFYLVVKDQYKDDNNEIFKMNKKKKRNLLDENFIERETIKNSEDQKEIKVLMEEKIKDRKKFAKSIYSNTFTEVNDENDKDKEENYMVKETDKEEKKLELVEPSFESISGRGTIISTNAINQSTAN